MNTKINIDVETLSKERSVFIATPMYGGNNSGFYMKSVLDLTGMLTQYGIKNTFFALFNESLITRARNYSADEFMRSGFTDLLFIDSDIEFSPMDVFGMLQITQNDPSKGIIGAAYPKKSIAWEKVKRAVELGYAEKNPFVLENYAGDFVFNPAKDGEYKIDEPIDVLEIGTGFMLINRSIFEVWNDQRPQYLYKPDHVRSKNFDGDRRIMAYFQDPIINERHLSEDYFFCQESRAMGINVTLCPWMQVHHIGTTKFVGNLPAVAATGMSPTADKNEVKGLK
jgi:hypothetical protein